MYPPVLTCKYLHVCTRSHPPSPVVRFSVSHTHSPSHTCSHRQMRSHRPMRSLGYSSPLVRSRPTGAHTTLVPHNNSTTGTTLGATDQTHASTRTHTCVPRVGHGTHCPPAHILRLPYWLSVTHTRHLDTGVSSFTPRARTCATTH